MALDAVQVEFLLSGMETTAGVPLSGGKVFTYVAGTSTPATTWQDNGKVTAHSNPIILDTRGRALVFADGVYKFVIKDSADNTIYTWDGLEYEPNPAPTPAFKGALVYNSTNQNAATGVFTHLSWDTEVYDTDAFHDNATNPQRFTIPAGVSRVRLTACVQHGSTLTTPGVTLMIFKNGYDFVVGLPQTVHSSDKTPVSTCGVSMTSHAIPVSQGDYFTVAMKHGNGADVIVYSDQGGGSIYSWFGIEVVA